MKLQSSYLHEVWSLAHKAKSVSHSPQKSIFSRGCESFDYSCPTGVTVSHDGRVYICEMNESLKVRETNGCHSEFPLRPGPNKDLFSEGIYCARTCYDSGVVVCDEAGNLAKFSKDGEFEWSIGEDPVQEGITCIQKFYLDSNGSIYLPQAGRVKVYSPDGVFSHDVVLVSDADFSGIAVDGDKNIHLGCKSSIKVFNTEGKLIHEYGHDGLGDVEIVAISEGNPQLVVAAEYDSSELFVFNSTGSFLYTVTGVPCVCDMTFGPDNSLWIAEWEAHHFGDVVCIPKLFHQLPPPLSYLCELSILPHLNELPVSLLPPRLAGLFEKWTDLVTVEVRRRSFTYQPSKSKLLSETIELKVEPDATRDMLQWLVCKRVGLDYSETSIGRSRDEGVDFVVIEC